MIPLTVIGSQGNNSTQDVAISLKSDWWRLWYARSANTRIYELICAPNAKTNSLLIHLSIYYACHSIKLPVSYHMSCTLHAESQHFVCIYCAQLCVISAPHAFINYIYITWLQRNLTAFIYFLQWSPPRIASLISASILLCAFDFCNSRATKNNIRNRSVRGIRRRRCN